MSDICCAFGFPPESSLKLRRKSDNQEFEVGNDLVCELMYEFLFCSQIRINLQMIKANTLS